MADENARSNFPGQTIPTLFADGVVNLAASSTVAKMYLYRLDPALNAEEVERPEVVAQVVMPLSGMLDTFLFWESAIKNWEEAGTIPAGELDRLRASRK